MLTVVIAGGVALVVCCFCMLCCVWWCRRKCRQRRERRANKPAVAGKVQEMSGRRMKKNPMAKKVHMRKETKLPKGWAGKLDPEGFKFYHNEKTGEVSWEAPEATLHSGPVIASAALAAAANSSGVKVHLRKSTVLPPGWSAHQDSDGFVFYSNNSTAKTSWDAPKGTKHSGEPMDKQEIEEMEKAEKAKASSDGVAINSKKGSVHARNETVLPARYQAQFDGEGYKFYLDTSTGAVSWEPPAGATGGSTREIERERCVYTPFLMPFSLSLSL